MSACAVRRKDVLSFAWFVGIAAALVLEQTTAQGSSRSPGTSTSSSAVSTLPAQTLTGGYGNNRCPANFAWTASGHTYGYESLKTDACSSTTLCSSPYPSPERPGLRPAPVEDVNYTFFGISLSPTLNSTCLHITFSLLRYGAANIKGLQFLLVGLGYSSHNNDCCQILNFTSELTYEAVCDVQNSECVPRKFSFSCFCDLYPSERYKLTIRTLPVDIENQTIPDDTSVVMDIEVPDCTAERKWDQYCQNSKEVRWRPQLLEMYQMFPQYNAVNVTFNIAPPNYHFKEYVVSLYEVGKDRPLLHQIIPVATGSFYEDTVNGFRVNATNVIFNELPDNYVNKVLEVGVLAMCPTNQNSCTAPNIKSAKSVKIIGNPCDTMPCGESELGTCSPDRDQYHCTCAEHAVFDDVTCRENPCNSSPCGDLGTCYVHPDMTYYCGCSDGLIYSGHTCIDDPCNPSPCDAYSTCHYDNITFEHHCSCTRGTTCIVDKCGKVTVPQSQCVRKASCKRGLLNLKDGMRYYIHNCYCGSASTFNSINVSDICVDSACGDGDGACNEHGTCGYTVVEGAVTFNCSCLHGYSLDDNGTCQKVNTPMVLIIVYVATCLILLALVILLSVCIKKTNFHQKFCLRHPYERNDDNERQQYAPVPVDRNLVAEEKRILIIATEETEEQRAVVYKFGAFLKQHAGLLPIIPSQNSTEIHKRSLEIWLSSENRRAFKILFLCSRGMWQRWDLERRGVKHRPERPGDWNPAYQESEFGDTFMKMVSITRPERETPGMLDKFLVAYFADDVSRETVKDIDIFSGLPHFGLMNDLEKLCFCLNATEQFTPSSSRKMPVIRQYSSTAEGRALHEAIEVMCQGPETTSADAEGTHAADQEALPKPLPKANLDDLTNIELQDISMDDFQSMERAKNFFFSGDSLEELSDSDQEGSLKEQEEMEVHSDSKESADSPKDSGFSQTFCSISDTHLSSIA